VFDPACGSGNFLVIAYKEMRAIEAEINRLRSEIDRRSDIPLTNFRGIELRDFPAEIARLALIIAEYQCDVLYRGQQEALAEFLPLDSQNWITCGNALRLDWLSICPPTGTGVKVRGYDLFETPLDQSEIDFENAGGETYICGNHPYRGSQQQSPEQKADMVVAFEGVGEATKALDYVAGWFAKAARYMVAYDGAAAFVATNSVNQGRQVELLWSPLFSKGIRISFAVPSFLWRNLASHNAGVTVSIIGITPQLNGKAQLFTDADGEFVSREVDNVNGYLVAAPNIEVSPARGALSGAPSMSFGNMPNDDGALLLSADEMRQAASIEGVPDNFVRPFIGSQEFINGVQKYCIWVDEGDAGFASENQFLNNRFQRVSSARRASSRAATRALADVPFAFGEIRQKGNEAAIIVPRITSERRPYLPVGLVEGGSIVSSQNFAVYNPELWVLACLASRLHRTWIATVCGRTRTDFAYSNTLGWNTFPLPKLTEQNKADLTSCAADILLARERHFPATIADLYDPESLPENLRAAHERNDEVLERIYIGRRFRNDTERLEKLFDLYTKMTAKAGPTKGKGKAA
jgi:hypothetical protein